jgi:hypothetical protein
MDLHRLAEERSLAYHRVVAERLRTDPRVLARARERVRLWIAEGRVPGGVPGYAREWERLLAAPVDTVCDALVADTEEGRARRQATPFAGVVGPRERWAIWKAVRQREEERR